MLIYDLDEEQLLELLKAGNGRITIDLSGHRNKVNTLIIPCKFLDIITSFSDEACLEIVFRDGPVEFSSADILSAQENAGEDCSYLAFTNNREIISSHNLGLAYVDDWVNASF